MSTISCFEERRDTSPSVGIPDIRKWYERDRARIIHSAGFRRLQAKTQILNLNESDFHRTRLTHSIEVAQIGNGLTQYLAHKLGVDHEVTPWLPHPMLMEAICLAHDLGHPPFGHGGEQALDQVMRPYGGFEGNGQTLRLIARLEKHSTGFGLNLTRRTLLGVMKYPVNYDDLVESGSKHPPKSYMASEQDIVDWILEPFGAEKEKFQTITTLKGKRKSAYMALDTSMLELADDISYGVHDLEDAITLGLIPRERIDYDFVQAYLPFYRRLGEAAPDPKILIESLFAKDASKRKRLIGRLVNALVYSCEVKSVDGFTHPLLKWNACLPPEAENFLEYLKGKVTEELIETRKIKMLRFKGQMMIKRLFDTFVENPDLVNIDHEKEDVHRAICDYIAGMTDDYASRIYERLFIPGTGSVFEQI